MHFDRKSCQAAAAVFKALGHPTRLWIVEQLGQCDERCVCEFVDAVGVDFSTVSQHLAILRQAGIVTDERRGKQVFYRLSYPCVLGFIACLQERCQVPCER